jgi:sulfate adenylyltransferase
MPELEINRRQYLEFEKLAFGAFAPLSGFMSEPEFSSVVRTMRLPTGEPFPLPVVLDLRADQAESIGPGMDVTLVFEDEEVGSLSSSDLFRCDKAEVVQQVFGTVETAHPGVAHFYRMGDFFVGGPVKLTRRVRFEFSDCELTPEETRARFREKGWQTVVGFQTRNVPHRAHEYLQRLALEQADGLFIQPLVGSKKRDDYTPEAILAGYRTLIDRFLPSERILLGVLSTSMRYAGPREAVFHAIIRRNYGCTHFIVGRDHAGVGDYYGTYDAHDLTRKFDGELGIEILRCRGPYHCARCGGIVTDRSCPHQSTEPEAVHEISGTLVRKMLSNGDISSDFMRPEVASSIADVPVFITEDAE